MGLCLAVPAPKGTVAVRVIIIIIIIIIIASAMMIIIMDDGTLGPAQMRARGTKWGPNAAFLQADCSNLGRDFQILGQGGENLCRVEKIRSQIF